MSVKDQVNLANCVHHEIRYPSKFLLSNLITLYFFSFRPKKSMQKNLTIGKKFLTHSRPFIWLE